MNRPSILTLTMAAGLALVTGLATGVSRADAPSPDHRGQAIGTIRYVDRAQNLVVMGDGRRLHAPDARMLEDLDEGDLVKLDFAHDTDGLVIRSIEPAVAGND